MIDEATKKPLQVKTDKLAGSSVEVSLGMRDKVLKLFQEHDIPHWAAHQAISVDGSPMMVMIYLRWEANPQAAQEILDRTP